MIHDTVAPARRRRLAKPVLAVAVILVVTAGGATPGPAAPSALAGIGHVTLVSDCPGGFKIPISAESHRDGTWTFAISGIHVGCVITWGNPIAFRGPWDPYAPSCDAQTGEGCPRSIDPTRPGFFALGAVPGELQMTITSLRFCVKGRCFEGWALVDRGSASEEVST